VEQLAAAALGGFIAWLLGKLVTFLTIRQRLLAYHVTVLNQHFLSILESRSWLDGFVSSTIVVGQQVNGAPRYTPDDFEDITAVRERSLELLSKSELVKFVCCVNHLIEVDRLMHGFCDSAKEFQNKDVVLNEGNVEFLSKRAERIVSIMALFPEKIASLKDLPEKCKYDSVISADELIISAKDG